MQTDAPPTCAWEHQEPVSIKPPPLDAHLEHDIVFPTTVHMLFHQIQECTAVLTEPGSNKKMLEQPAREILNASADIARVNNADPNQAWKNQAN